MFSESHSANYMLATLRFDAYLDFKLSMELTLLGNHKTVAIAQAMISDSARLFGKVLLDINGMPAIEWVVRAARAIPQIDGVDCNIE